jgi:septal ring factor EnvC (AmiA/AmiB activator)
MWVNEKTLLVGSKLVEENVRLQGEIASLRQQLEAAVTSRREALDALNRDFVAVANELENKQRTIDWFTTTVNDLKIERAALLERILGVTMPVAAFGRLDEPINLGHEPAPVGPETPEAAALRRATAIYHRNANTENLQPVDPLREFAEKGAGIFEDVGDREAARQGLEWGPEGEVVNG